MPPRLPSPASKLAFPSPNHIALQETNICAQLTQDFLSRERAVLSGTSTKLVTAEPMAHHRFHSSIEAMML
jgi:hypothetical protein